MHIHWCQSGKYFCHNSAAKITVCLTVILCNFGHRPIGSTQCKHYVCTRVRLWPAGNRAVVVSTTIITFETAYMCQLAAVMYKDSLLRVSLHHSLTGK